MRFKTHAPRFRTQGRSRSSWRYFIFCAFNTHEVHIKYSISVIARRIRYFIRAFENERRPRVQQQNNDVLRGSFTILTQTVLGLGTIVSPWEMVAAISQASSKYVAVGSILQSKKITQNSKGKFTYESINGFSLTSPSLGFSTAALPPTHTLSVVLFIVGSLERWCVPASAPAPAPAEAPTTQTQPCARHRSRHFKSLISMSVFLPAIVGRAFAA